MSTPESEKLANSIKNLIQEMMERVLNNVLKKDPFLPDLHKASKPIYAALVPDEIFKGSHFERRFVTPFGSVWEKLAELVANETLGYSKRGHTVSGEIKESRLRRISETLNTLEHKNAGETKRKKPNWNEELNYILAASSGKSVPIQVVCDVYAENIKSKESYAFEIKAPLPNSDQTKVSKEKMFKLYAMEPRKITEAYYVLPYNPYGRKEHYNWKFPLRWFDMVNDPVVLIGGEFWDKLGGAGTFENFITELNKIGQEYKERIYREYLEMEPPDYYDESKIHIIK